MSFDAPRREQPHPHLDFRFLASRTREERPVVSATRLWTSSGSRRKPVRAMARPARGAPGLEGNWPNAGHAGGRLPPGVSAALLWKPSLGAGNLLLDTRSAGQPLRFSGTT